MQQRPSFTPQRRSQAAGSTPSPVFRSWSWRRIGFAIGLVVILGGVWWVVSRPTPVQPGDAQVTQAPRQGFPTLDATALTARQKHVVALAKQEYLKNPVSYDATVKVYTEGFTESWCADFISWVFYKAGVGYEHPDTGYWRIPGVQTLAAYYQKMGAYHELGDGYTPKIGDVAFYFGETPDGGSSEHVAMVLAVEGDRVVTIGGNETDKGILQVRHDKIDPDVKGLSAFGASGI